MADEKENVKQKESVKQESSGNGSNTHDKEKATFDWVTRRSSCSLPAVFKELRAEVEQDVNTRNGLRPNYAPYEFSIADQDGSFSVFLKAKELQMTVMFVLGEHGIQVRDDKGIAMFDVTLSFNECGECRLKVDGAEREYWQVRRMALEDLMFHGY
ncbi:MAG: hypothetical protein WCC95_16800 [Candidatus Sulfotelmatobacter sp.]|jgi:hypothetical protein